MTGKTSTVFIPAYNQVELVEGCIRSVLSCFVGSISILDDSDRRGVAEAVAEIGQLRSGAELSYQPRLQPLQRKNHISNWNRYLELKNSSSSYLNLRHHDDYLIPDLSRGLNAELNDEGGPMLIIHPVLVPILKIKRLTIARYHSPPCLQRLLLRYFPAELLTLVNYIGPTACVWIKEELAELAPGFDERLKWLVDCNWYVSLLNHCKPTDIRISNRAANRSIPHSGTITAHLKPKIAELERDELQLLASQMRISSSLKRLAQTVRVVNRFMSLLVIRIYIET
jgi:hypothetical protein